MFHDNEQGLCVLGSWIKSNEKIIQKITSGKRLSFILLGHIKQVGGLKDPHKA